MCGNNTSMLDQAVELDHPAFEVVASQFSHDKFPLVGVKPAKHSFYRIRWKLHR
jgi:hypothetical protein